MEKNEIIQIVGVTFMVMGLLAWIAWNMYRIG